MRFISELLIGDDIKPKQIKKIRQRLMNGKRIRGLNIIIMRKNTPNLLEIVNTKELYYRNQKEMVYVVGITKSNGIAIDLIIDTMNQLMDDALAINKNGLYTLFEINEKG